MRSSIFPSSTAHPTDRVLYVRADQGLAYHVVREAMHVAQESGIVAVGMVTEAPRPARARPARR